EINSNYSKENIIALKEKYKNERLVQNIEEYNKINDKKVKRITGQFYTWNFKLALLAVMCTLIIVNVFIGEPAFTAEEMDPQWYICMLMVLSRLYNNIFNICAVILLWIELRERKEDFNFADRLSKIK
ncbi:MAG: hypothetical protein K5776_07280, partial [Lachnospiraceae bacterium]|nr:hypothetical protein [Lachnospiraceae bacterium]